LESSKEFVSRMMMMISELPEEKRRDQYTLLSFLSFQLKARDRDIVRTFTHRTLHSVESSNNMPRRFKDEVRQKIRGVCRSAEYTFAIPLLDKESVEEILGKQADKPNIKTAK
jgi:hypothetical protein